MPYTNAFEGVCFEGLHNENKNAAIQVATTMRGKGTDIGEIRESSTNHRNARKRVAVSYYRRVLTTFIETVFRL